MDIFLSVLVFCLISFNGGLAMGRDYSLGGMLNCIGDAMKLYVKKWIGWWVKLALVTVTFLNLFDGVP